MDEIAIKAKPDANLTLMKQILLDEGADKTSRVKLWDEAQPKFLKDIKTAFSLLGTIIGSIGLVVASITIFIVIFVNAVTRRKYIGILKGIGVNIVKIGSFSLLAVIGLSGCSITQTVNPVPPLDTNSICIINNENARETFRDAYKHALEKKNYVVKVLEKAPVKK